MKKLLSKKKKAGREWQSADLSFKVRGPRLGVTLLRKKKKKAGREWRTADTKEKKTNTVTKQEKAGACFLVVYLVVVYLVSV